MVARAQALANYQKRFNLGTDAFVRPAGEARVQAASGESTLKRDRYQRVEVGVSAPRKIGTAIGLLGPRNYFAK